jgi:hypothetical protein
MNRAVVVFPSYQLSISPHSRHSVNTRTVNVQNLHRNCIYGHGERIVAVGSVDAINHKRGLHFVAEF